MVEIYLLEQLVAFADCGTQVAAAEQLHITQPALSRSMRKLESQLGVALFDRATSKIALNDTGRLAAEQARIVLAADQALEDRVRAYDRSLRTLTVGACAPMPLGDVLTAIQRCYMGIGMTTSIEPDERLIKQLRAHDLQIAILHEEPEGDDLMAKPFLTERLCVSVPHGHPLEGRDEVHFSDLAGVTILANGDAGFWVDLCRSNMPHAGLLVQEGMDQLAQLVNVSTLPVFSSDLTVARTGEVPGRMTIPIADAEAVVTYHIACLASEADRFSALFSAL